MDSVPNANDPTTPLPNEIAGQQHRETSRSAEAKFDEEEEEEEQQHASSAATMETPHQQQQQRRPFIPYASAVQTQPPPQRRRRRGRQQGNTESEDDDDNISVESERTRKRRERNTTYRRRTRARQRIELEVFREQSSALNASNLDLYHKNKRLEHLLEQANAIVTEHEQQRSETQTEDEDERKPPALPRQLQAREQITPPSREVAPHPPSTQVSELLQRIHQTAQQGRESTDVAHFVQNVPAGTGPAVHPLLQFLFQQKQQPAFQPARQLPVQEPSPSSSAVPAPAPAATGTLIATTLLRDALQQARPLGSTSTAQGHQRSNPPHTPNAEQIQIIASRLQELLQLPIGSTAITQGPRSTLQLSVGSQNAELIRRIMSTVPNLYQPPGVQTTRISQQEEFSQAPLSNLRLSKNPSVGVSTDTTNADMIQRPLSGHRYLAGPAQHQEGGPCPIIDIMEQDHASQDETVAGSSRIPRRLSSAPPSAVNTTSPSAALIQGTINTHRSQAGQAEQQEGGSIGISRSAEPARQAAAASTAQKEPILDPRLATNPTAALVRGLLEAAVQSRFTTGTQLQLPEGVPAPQQPLIPMNLVAAELIRRVFDAQRHTQHHQRQQQVQQQQQQVGGTTVSSACASRAASTREQAVLDLLRSNTPVADQFRATVGAAPQAPATTEIDAVRALLTRAAQEHQTGSIQESGRASSGAMTDGVMPMALGTQRCQQQPGADVGEQGEASQRTRSSDAEPDADEQNDDERLAGDEDND